MQNKKPRGSVLLLFLILCVLPFAARFSLDHSAPENLAADVTSGTVASRREPAATGGSQVPGLPSQPASQASAADLPARAGHPAANGGASLMTIANRGNAVGGKSVRRDAAAGKTVAMIVKDADMTDPQVRGRVVAEMRALEKLQRNAVLDKAAKLGVPLRKDGPGHKVSMLYDFRGDEPLYRTTLNANAAISSAANLLAPAPYSLNGSGIRVGVWDAGSVRNTHQELTGRVTKKNSTAALDAHATHVAGTIGAAGVQANAKGMAPQATIDSYDWFDDYSEMTAAGAAAAGDTASIPFSNHSYGYDALTSDMGRYEEEAVAVDAIAVSLPFYLPFWAAGNEQDVLTAKGGYQSITFNGLAKNIVTVGAVNDAVSSGVRNPAAGSIAYFSSLGPCDDGRIKPDLVANGISLYSCISTSNTAYDGTYSGTSMATPSAMGSAALVAQLHAREFSGQRLRASAMKALLIHSADDIGNPGPDYTYGWGLINVKAAAGIVLAHKASLAAPKIIDGSLTNADKTDTHTFIWDGVSPIRATLCWTDPAGDPQDGADSRSANLVHNLDAKITAPDGTTIHRPFVMPFAGNWSTAAMASAAITGKNNVDTVEQVYLATPAQTGSYTVTVSLDGSLTTASQVYSLVITGGTDVATNPPPDIALTSPAEGAVYLPGQPVTISANATDLAIGGAPGAVSEVEFFAGSTSIGVDSTAPYAIDWIPLSVGSHVITARATDNEGATAASAAVTITVLAGDGVPVVSSFSPASGPTGAAVDLTGVNFINVSAVRFNGVDAGFTVHSSGSITATVPALATTGRIAVINSYGTGTSAGVFTVLESPVLISQIYGAGGNSGATYRQDYVELHNRGDSAVSLTGWSVQYASSSGTTWQAAALGGSIQPGGYHLVGLGSGSSGLTLPAPDSSGSIAMSATAGKVALVNTTSTLAGSSPVTSENVRDFVGYGAANASEGSPAPAPSTTTAIFRAGGGATDTFDNSADFTVGAPAPRNSSSGPPVAPVITSPAAASATAGSPFFYQITATNLPASFAAAGLPDGLAVNAATGAIAGTPVAAGTSVATISATNSAGTGTADLSLTVHPAATVPVTLFSENMGSPAATTAIASNAFQNDGLAFSGTSDVRNTTPSSGYSGASGEGNIFITNTVGRDFVISGIDTSGHSGLVLSFGHHKSTTASTNELVVEVGTDGNNYAALTYTRASGSGTTTWLSITPTGAIPSTANLHIRFRQTSATAQFRIDDVVLKGTATSRPTPVISTSGSLSGVDTVYGSHSPVPASFTVAGTGITGGILITAPAGFEISQSSGGTDGFAATQLVSGSGTIPQTTIHLRLAAGIAAGSYSGNVVCSSTGALAVDVPATPSSVGLKLLIITAADRSKPFGSALTLGAGQTAFLSSGLVGAETIGSVTLTASGGMAVNDAPGTYSITPSSATGGTFNPSNYDFDYVAGTLTVTPFTYADWLAGHPDLADTSATADPDRDGVSNLIEYFMGLDPEAADPGTGITAITGSDSFSMIYRRAKGIDGVSGAVKWSADLLPGSWSGDGVGETAQDMGSYELRTATVPRTGQETRKFLRLEVVKP